MRSTLFIFLLILTACDSGPSPSAAYQLTPATFSDADFNTQGELVISLREQIAIFSTDGDMLQLIEAGEADGAWQVNWIAPHLLAVADNHQILLWHTQQKEFTGSWNFTDAPLRTLEGASGRLMAGDAEGSLHLLEFDPAGTLQETYQLHQHAEQVAAIEISPDGAYAFSASRNGEVRGWSLAKRQLKWKQTLQAGRYATALAFNPTTHVMYLATAPRGQLLGSPAEQAIVHLDAKNGTISTVHPFNAESHIVSLLASDLGLVIGGSANQWWLVQDGDVRVTRQYPRGGAFGHDSGTLVALYSSQDSLHTVTTSGYLQIWLKQDIVNSSTD